MPSDPNRSVPKAILVGAMVAALLDMVDPIIFYGLRGIPPRQIPQSIASGILAAPRTLTASPASSSVWLRISSSHWSGRRSSF